MKMRKLVVMAVGFVATLGIMGVVYAEQFRSPVEFYSDVNFDSSAVWKINGTKVTATAAQLNAAGAGSTATITPNLIVTAPQSQSVTNGQPVTLAGSLNILTGINGTNGATDTITLADPGTSGKMVTIVVGSASTNFVALADSGNVRLAGAWSGGSNDTLTLYAVATNYWNEADRSDN